MKDNFAKAMAIVLAFEGGKVDDPQDPGGRTNQGVTQATYRAWRLNNRLGDQTVFDMTADERDVIYRLQYADKIKFDGLPAGLDLLMLDCAINSGPVQATKWLQRALGTSYAGKIDGIMGEGTFRAVVNCMDDVALIDAVCARRLAFLKALKTFRRFGRGWTNRVEQIQKFGEQWAGGIDVAAIPVALPNAGKKADLSDAKAIPSTAPGALTGGAGVTVAGTTTVATTWLAQAKEKLAEISFIPHMDAVNLYLDHARSLVETGGWFAGSVATIGGGAWLLYAKRRAAKLHDALDTLPAASAPVASSNLAPVGAS